MRNSHKIKIKDNKERERVSLKNKKATYININYIHLVYATIH